MLVVEPAAGGRRGWRQRRRGGRAGRRGRGGAGRGGRAGGGRGARAGRRAGRRRGRELDVACSRRGVPTRSSSWSCRGGRAGRRGRGGAGRGRRAGRGRVLELVDDEVELDVVVLDAVGPVVVVVAAASSTWTRWSTRTWRSWWRSTSWWRTRSSSWSTCWSTTRWTGRRGARRRRAGGRRRRRQRGRGRRAGGRGGAGRGRRRRARAGRRAAVEVVVGGVATQGPRATRVVWTGGDAAGARDGRRLAGVLDHVGGGRDGAADGHGVVRLQDVLAIRAGRRDLGAGVERQGAGVERDEAARRARRVQVARRLDLHGGTAHVDRAAEAGGGIGVHLAGGVDGRGDDMQRPAAGAPADVDRPEAERAGRRHCRTRRRSRRPYPSRWSRTG